MIHRLTREAIVSGRDLATALDWDGGDLNVRRLNVRQRSLDLTSAKIEGQGAVVFSSVPDLARVEDVNAVALYGYHAQCPWGMLADDNGIHVVSSQWLRDFDWYKVPLIEWGSVTQSAKLLEAFTPTGLRHGEPRRALSSFPEPTELLRSVDDALVERLDDWRDKAVRFSRGAVSRVDEHLQTLYAQLFVLRTVEDRGLNAGIPPAMSCVGSDSQFDHEQWRIIFAAAQAGIGSDLFEFDATSGIDDYVLCGVINDLYRPRGVPGRNTKYDFSWISADVLGLAYEKYLSTVLQPAPLPAQSDFFLHPQRGVERYSVRKSAGAYYTPRFLTTYLATTCVDRFFSASPVGSLPRIIDFSCGSGSFLVAAIDQVLGHLKRRDPARAWARELIDGGYIAGIDIDRKAVTAARLHLWQRLIEEPDALPLPNLSNVVLTGDGLDASTWGPLQEQYDIVLGNPPFLATTMVSDRERLEANFVTARGRYDFSSLFVEQALNVLKDGGYLGLVIPNRLFINASAITLRSMLTERAAIETVVDFGSTKLFDADAYVGSVIAKKGGAVQGTVRVIEVRGIEEDYLTASLLNAQVEDTGSRNSSIESFTARHPGAAPWILLSATERSNRIAVEDAATALIEIATVAQGIKTGANDLFVLDIQDDDSQGLCKIQNGYGDQWFIEKDLLAPVVYGSELQRYRMVVPQKYILYPYKGNVAITEAELSSLYPRTHEYLRGYRELLSSRASLKGSSASFYELIRQRDEAWLRRSKLLIRDLAPATAFAADLTGHAMLIGGTAVVPEDETIGLALLAYLNSRLVNSLIRNQSPSFKNDFRKFEPGVLSRIPVLNVLLEDPLLQAHLSDLAHQRLSMPGIGSEGAKVEEEIEKVIIDAARAVNVNISD